MTDFDVDLFVIGAGSGGTRAARIAAGHGARVMIAEEDRIGGTCVIRGCVPKKLFVYASRFAEDFEDAAGFGWTLPQAPVFDWATLRDAVANEVTRLSGLYRKGLEGAKVAIREERAVVEGPHQVRLVKSGEVIRARHILVATGGWPSFDPPIPGGELGISSNEVFNLPALPKRLLVVGGGYIALEFASLFARLGVAVTVLHRGDNILRGFDEDIRTRLRDALVHAGITLRLGCTIDRIEELADGSRRAHCAKGEPIDADVVLVATGRRPNTKGLGLDKAGVAQGPLGEIKVDAASASSVPSIPRGSMKPRRQSIRADTRVRSRPSAMVSTSGPSKGSAELRQWLWVCNRNPPSPPKGPPEKRRWKVRSDTTEGMVVLSSSSRRV